MQKGQVVHLDFQMQLAHALRVRVRQPAAQVAASSTLLLCSQVAPPPQTATWLAAAVPCCVHQVGVSCGYTAGSQAADVFAP